MGISLKVNCDVCGEERKQTNHWFKVTTPGKGFGRRAVITDFPPNQKIQRPSTKLACGHECLHKLIDRIFGVGSVFT